VLRKIECEGASIRNSALARVCFPFALYAVTLGNMGCSAGGNGLLNPPSVHAQDRATDQADLSPRYHRYSNSSLNGTYTLTMSAGEAGNIVTPVSFLGSVTFDGKGNITAGTITEAATPHYGSTATCPVSVTGTYSLSANATGTASLAFTGRIVSPSATPVEGTIGNGNNRFAIPPSLTLSIAAHRGEVVAFQMAQGSSSGFNFAGTAYRQ